MIPHPYHRSRVIMPLADGDLRGLEPDSLDWYSILDMMHSLAYTILCLNKKNLYYFDIKEDNLLYKRLSKSVIHFMFGDVGSLYDPTLTSSTIIYTPPYNQTTMWGPNKNNYTNNRMQSYSIIYMCLRLSDKYGININTLPKIVKVLYNKIKNTMVQNSGQSQVPLSDIPTLEQLVDILTSYKQELTRKGVYEQTKDLEQANSEVIQINQLDMAEQQAVQQMAQPQPQPQPIPSRVEEARRADRERFDRMKEEARQQRQLEEERRQEAAKRMVEAERRMQEEERRQLAARRMQEEERRQEAARRMVEAERRMQEEERRQLGARRAERMRQEEERRQEAARRLVRAEALQEADERRYLADIQDRRTRRSDSGYKTDDIIPMPVDYGSDVVPMDLD